MKKYKILFKAALVFFLMGYTSAETGKAPESKVDESTFEEFVSPYKNYNYWYKGNTHTHTNRSEDADLPVVEVAKLYSDSGYDFIALTDHNTVTEGNANNILLIKGCESGDWWENHLGAINADQCPEECASNAFAPKSKPFCNNQENQKRINQALSGHPENVIVVLHHPTSVNSKGVEQGWSKAKMAAVHGYDAVEIDSYWDFILGYKRKVWGIAADDSHGASGIGRGFIMVNSDKLIIDKNDVIKNIKEGNFYSVKVSKKGASHPELRKIQIVSGNFINVTFANADKIRFIDNEGIVYEKTIPGAYEQEKGYIYQTGWTQDFPYPKGYLRIELEDKFGNVSYSQPLFLKNTDISAFQNQAPGSQYNFEVFVREFRNGRHFGFNWHNGKWDAGQRFGEDYFKSAPAVFQNRAPGSENNYEAFVWESDHIQQYWRGWGDGKWHKGSSFGGNVQSAPAAFQNRNSTGLYDYDVFVREEDHIQHYRRGWRDGQWHKEQQFGGDVRSAPAAFQNMAPDKKFNYEVFVREGNHVQHYEFSGGTWRKGAQFGQNVQSAPVAFQNMDSQDPDKTYNYEIFVREGNQIQHYLLDHKSGQVKKGERLGENVQSAPAAFQNLNPADKERYNGIELFFYESREGDYISHHSLIKESHRPKGRKSNTTWYRWIKRADFGYLERIY